MPQGIKKQGAHARPAGHSHSIVEGGFDVMSYTILFTGSTSLTILELILSSTSYGILAQSEVMPSMEVTARIPTKWL